MSKKNTAEQMQIEEVAMIEEMEERELWDEPEFPTQDGLRDMFMSLTKKELLDILGNDNITREAEGLVPLSFNSKTKHEDLVDLVLRGARINGETVTPSLVHSLGHNNEEVLYVQPEDVGTSTYNPRHEMDYEDKKLQMNILSSRGFTKRPVVYEAAIFGNESCKFEVLAGNRSFFNMVKLLEGIEGGSIQASDEEKDWASTVRAQGIPVSYRAYQGAKEDQQLQIIKELRQDNESLAFTKIDDLRLIQAEISRGMTPKSCAEVRGTSTTWIYSLLKLATLSEAVQDLIHIGQRLDYLKGKSDQELRELYLNFEGTGEDRLIPHITFVSALDMVDLLPPRPKKTGKKVKEYQAELSLWEQECGKFSEVFSLPLVARQCVKLTREQFKEYLTNVLIERGLVEGNPKAEEPVFEAPEEQASTPSTTPTEEPTKVVDKGLGAASWYIVEECLKDHVMLESLFNNDDIGLPEDWFSRLKEQIEAGNKEARKCLISMVKCAIFVDYNNDDYNQIAATENE